MSTIDAHSITRTFEVRDTRNRTVIVPGYTASFHVIASRAPSVLEELLLAAGKALDDRLSHVTYRFEGDWKRWSGATHVERLTTWFRRPRPNKLYHLNATGCVKEASPAALSAAFEIATSPGSPPPKGRDLERATARFARELKKLEVFYARAVAKGHVAADVAQAGLLDVRRTMALQLQRGSAPPELSDAHVHIGFPLDAFSSPVDFRHWMSARSASGSRALVSAHGGIGLQWWMDPYDLSYEQNNLSLKRLGGMLLRHPAVDWDRVGDIHCPLRPFEPPDGAHDRRYIKRGRWLNIVPQEIIDAAGGTDALTRDVAIHKDCTVESLGANHLIVAGVSPDPTGPLADDLLSACRHVNRLLRGSQITEYRSEIPNADDFSELFLSLSGDV